MAERRFDSGDPATIQWEKRGNTYPIGAKSWNAAMDKIADLEQQLAAAKDEINRLHDKVNPMANELGEVKFELAAANARIAECEKGLKVYNDENQELVDVINEELRVKEPHSPKQLVRLAGERLAGALALWDDEICHLIVPDTDDKRQRAIDAANLQKFEKLLRGGST